MVIIIIARQCSPQQCSTFSGKNFNWYSYIVWVSCTDFCFNYWTRRFDGESNIWQICLWEAIGGFYIGNSSYHVFLLKFLHFELWLYERVHIVLNFNIGIFFEKSPIKSSCTVWQLIQTNKIKLHTITCVLAAKDTGIDSLKLLTCFGSAYLK